MGGGGERGRCRVGVGRFILGISLGFEVFIVNFLIFLLRYVIIIFKLIIVVIVVVVLVGEKRGGNIDNFLGALSLRDVLGRCLGIVGDIVFIFSRSFIFLSGF